LFFGFELFLPYAASYLVSNLFLMLAGASLVACHHQKSGFSPA
jgi:hypothetical protein